MLPELLLRLDGFLEGGGPVLWAIAGVCVLLWSLILERFLFFWVVFPRELRRAEARWFAWAERRCWRAEKVRSAMVSELRLLLGRHLPLIRALIAACPLLGLLGTVSGMIRIFDVMAHLQGADASAMAAGVSMATVPTLAGLVVALSGLACTGQLRRLERRLGERCAGRLGFREEEAAS